MNRTRCCPVCFVFMSIENRQIVSFRYYAPEKDSVRRAEPYYLIFKWSSWYLWGFCLEREDFRLFKLNRMDQLIRLKEHFAQREVPMPDLSMDTLYPRDIEVQAVFEAESKDLWGSQLPTITKQERRSI